MRAITGEALRRAIDEQSFVKGGDPSSVEGVKYDFHLGTKVLKAALRTPRDMSEMTPGERSDVVVEPGEVVFVMSEEKLSLPVHMIATLIPKRKLAHEGIMVLGGLLVDPMYEGYLLIGLYNFCSKSFIIEPGRKLIAAVFYELEDDELGEFPIPEEPILDFPDTLRALMEKYKPVALHDIKDAIERTQRELSDLKAEVLTGQNWIQEFRNDLKEHSDLIGQLGKELRGERDNRVAADKEFREQLLGMQTRQMKQSATLALIVGATIITAAAIINYIVPLIIPAAGP